MTRSGFVAVVGRPNVGKSTLVNALVGSKVAITSKRPQTTRNRIRGVVTRRNAAGEPESQVVLVDTPGLHKPKTALGERLNALVYGTLAESDVNLFLLDAMQPVGPGDRLIAERLGAAGTPVVVVVNKIDIAPKPAVAERLIEAAAWDFDAYVPASALEKEALEPVMDELIARLPEGPLFFPSDAVSDQPEHQLVGEIVREKFLDRLREELPHSLTVVVREMEERESGTLYVDAVAIVERSSQKGIIIGKGGEMLRTAGSEARAELETIFGTKVFLDLRVRVEKDWQQQPELLDRLGFPG
ncbi:MAG TPA: GTPase Era [Acidimicrobiia bacterium]|nr:GTPase Era [Acidimicrobiia bacterium]